MLIFRIELDDLPLEMISIGSDFDKFDYRYIQCYNKTIEYCHSLDILYYGSVADDEGYSESFNVFYLL